MNEIYEHDLVMLIATLMTAVITPIVLAILNRNYRHRNKEAQDKYKETQSNTAEIKVLKAENAKKDIVIAQHEERFKAMNNRINKIEK